MIIIIMFCYNLISTLSVLYEFDLALFFLFPFSNYALSDAMDEIISHDAKIFKEIKIFECIFAYEIGLSIFTITILTVI